MALSSIQSEKPLQTQTPREPRAANPKSEAVPLDAETSPAVTVELGGEVAASQLSRILSERVLSRIETELAPPVREALQTAAKPGFDGAPVATRPDETSAEATASRIVEAVTGRLFKAFRTRNPEMTREDLLGFQEQVLRGFEAGVSDAKDILTGLRVMSPDMSASIEETRLLAQDGLSRFFEEALAAAPRDA